MKKKVGLIVNPIAGLGGSVGLKGSDGNNIVEQALTLGASPYSGARAVTALKVLVPLSSNIELYTCYGLMGETVSREVGLEAKLIGQPRAIDNSLYNRLKSTTAQDTIETAKEMLCIGCELILFAGGDGTARNIYEAVGYKVPVIGIPTGVKMHSAVYATNPRNAGELAAELISGQICQFIDGEVMDIDEDEFRKGRVSARLFGYMKVPLSRVHLQGGKISISSDPNSVKGIARTIVEDMKPETLYIIGPGSTTTPIMELLGLPFTLLGVDLVKNKKLVANDVTKKQILYELSANSHAAIIVTPIGGQASLFGRGNQQIGPEVINCVGKNNIQIVATQAKINSFYGNCMKVDTGDEKLDSELCGYYRVIVSYKQEIVFRIEC